MMLTAVDSHVLRPMSYADDGAPGDMPALIP